LTQSNLVHSVSDHIEVHALHVDFAEQNRLPRPLAGTITQRPVMQTIKDPVAGKRVLVVGLNKFCGYHGTIIHTHEHLKMYEVRMDANGKVMRFKEEFLVEIS
jgi:hypothetical protein